MNIPQLTARLLDQMTSFLGNLFRSVPRKTARRFCQESLYGIVTRQSLHLTEIARSLEETISLGKTENRLSRQAAREDLHEQIHDFVIRESAHRVHKDTLLVVDPSDIVKCYAQRMEYLACVRDGSDGGYGNGYWLCQVIGVQCGGHEITPLVNHLWSHDEPAHKSENHEVLSCVARVAKHTGERGIWVIDRGGDRMSLMRVLLHWKLRFLIRLIGNRHLLYKGKKMLASDLARLCKCPCARVVTKQKKDGSEEHLELSYGCLPVELPAFPGKELRLIVLNGFPGGPIMTLTTEPITNSRRSLEWAIEAYLTRWRIEETIRFAKQTYALEDVRVLGYQSLRNMMALALLAMSFTMTWLGTKEKLAVLAFHALKAAKRLFGVPDFRYYALADGLAAIFRKRIKAPFASQGVLPFQGDLDIFAGLSP